MPFNYFTTLSGHEPIIILRNRGYGNGYNVQAILRSRDPRLVVLDSFGEFGDSLSYYQASSIRDKFQVLIYNASVPTPSTDNVIVFQYQTANRFSSSTIGIHYLYDDLYHPASAGIVSGRAIKFTTSAPMTAIKTEYNPISNITKKLFANYPNPFKSQTTIRYALPKESKVSLQIYDISGRLIRNLINQSQPTGVYTIKWDGKNEYGEDVSSGIYFCKLQTDKDTWLKKLTIIK